MYTALKRFSVKWFVPVQGWMVRGLQPLQIIMNRLPISTCIHGLLLQEDAACGQAQHYAHTHKHVQLLELEVLISVNLTTLQCSACWQFNELSSRNSGRSHYRQPNLINTLQYGIFHPPAKLYSYLQTTCLIML